MTNLYVFAIGGSGERVLRSLVMILSAGVSIGADRIIPVIIDNDEESYALKKCLETIDYYNSTPAKDGKMGANSCYECLSEDNKVWGSFFHTKIDQPIVLMQAGRAIGNLNKIIGPLDSDNQNMKLISEERDLLFSQDDLCMPLNVGFVGNPNIGSIVLNSLSFQDDKFSDIIEHISSNDGVFVIGSLFGGTGAAGLPLVINTFNQIGDKRPVLGAGALLPYFTFGEADKTVHIIDTNKWDVDSSTFDVKTRAALMYYDVYMCQTNNLDYMYYAGDDLRDAYQHYVGGKDQINPANRVELMMALSVVDFSKKGHSEKIEYIRPVIKTTKDNTINVEGINNADFKKAMIKFQILKVMFENDNFLKEAVSQKRSFVKNIKFTEEIRSAVVNDYEQFESSYGINKLFKEWDKWLGELSGDKVKRKFMLCKDTKTATVDDIFSYFYSEMEYGLAKTKLCKPIFGKSYTKPLEAQITDALLDTYNKLSENKILSVDDDKKILPALLKIVSDALDDVIANKCVQL